MALTGDPVMCVLIFEQKTSDGSIETDINITIKSNRYQSDPNFVEIDSVNVKYFPGDPRCEYKEKSPSCHYR